ncbi:NAD kinase [Aerococcaceae bacterium NML130460]|nr:NAD kinase [Aerococcaceae bacterium NML130460]MDO4774398.1 NAD kinase [Aerococcaceae bacterium]
MKKVLLYANYKPESQAIKQQLVKLLEATDIQVVDRSSTPDYVITIGGDGTMLSAFHEFQELLDTVQFIGIHTGHLGFYADWQGHELEPLVKCLQKASGKRVSYPLLEVTLNMKNGSQRKILALNEFSIRTIAGTIVCDVFIKESFFETFRGDGLCIATPTGSTGLSKSLGGAVLHPRLEAIQLTEMASLNNRIYRTLSSPAVIPSDEYFVLKPSERNKDVVMMVDHKAARLPQVKSIRLQVAKQKIHFASIRHTHFWDRVENSFIGQK